MSARADYEQAARRIAATIGLRVSVVEHRQQTCPTWRSPCDHMHGLRYRVRLSRVPGPRSSLSFDFWSSHADAQQGQAPGYYSVLSCVSSDASGPTDPDEVAEEYGPMKPSQAIAVARHAARLQAFFTEAELTALSEIQ